MLTHKITKKQREENPANGLKLKKKCKNIKCKRICFPVAGYCDECYREAMRLLGSGSKKPQFLDTQKRKKKSKHTRHFKELK